MSAESDFERYTRPELSRLFRALRLDVTYRAGQGDHLTRELREAEDGAAGTEQILDLVGGAGSSLFGHNHPKLLGIARRVLDERIPFNAQISVRPGTAELAKRLSKAVGATTGARYVVTLGNTGADAVEAAVKHAAVEHRRRLGALQEETEQTLRRVRRDGLADTPLASGPALGRPCAVVLNEALERIAAMRRRDPVYVSLRNAFHGKSAGAGTLTHGSNVPHDLHVPGPAHRRLSDWTPQKVVTALDAECDSVCLVSIDAAGVPHSAVRRLSPVAACFAEPIQGESGVHEVPAETLAALRELADRHEAALVFDEIQCGMGRTGTFLASEASGVVADYYTLSKSLGGGLAKISALLIDEKRYVPEFGRHHTSTFADDDFSALIATGALELSFTYRDRIVETGRLLRERLDEVAAKYPDAVVGVRGRGLLLGIEFVLPRPESGLLREAIDSESLGYLIAGRLLYTHRIRVIPTLSAPTTVRVQPSALLEPADVERVAAAFDDVAGLLARGDYATLLEHLTVPAASAWQPRTHVPLPRSAWRPRHGTRRPGVPRVAFLANIDSPAKLGSLAPELASWSQAQSAAALDRMWGEIDPFEVIRHHVTSAAGGEVEVVMVAAPFTAAQANAGLRAGHGAWLRRAVLDAVDLGASLGCEVIGLGGHTSIVTNAARDVVENGMKVTSGNSLTAACAYDLLRLQLAESGGERRVGLVGGIGNIGAVMAELIAPHCDSMVLVGRPGSTRRLATVADRLTGSADITLAEDMSALRDCPIVISATNSAEPVILPHHLADDQKVLVCDLAVPGDVHPEVTGMPHVTLVSGGRIQLPGVQTPHFPGLTLPPGILYSCMAETMLLSFEPEMRSLSYGGLTSTGVLAARDLAARHGFHPARIVCDDISVQPWIEERSGTTTEERLG
ncbi:aminotransferase class III-fold pyridoxal phosphate-dependent enzyme [Streptomyces sp. NPDC058195]|uniref:aminotransferase class III-fold pyridoxal phosphate-dependent enzyme n=1 Tax=Streptomyces sp. NPDC058195 TaxID=3346375 RepID=UPI0036E78EB5